MTQYAAAGGTIMGMRRKDLRPCAETALTRRGFSVRPKLVRGIPRGARLLATKEGKSCAAAVRTSLNRTVGFTRDASGRWLPLASVDLVLVVLPSGSPQEAEVLSFDPGVLSTIFSERFEFLMRDGLKIPQKAPVFISLDEKLPDGTRLLDHVNWREVVPLQEAKPVPTNVFSHQVEQLKQQFAEVNGIEPAKVVVEFRLIY